MATQLGDVVAEMREQMATLNRRDMEREREVREMRVEIDRLQRRVADMETQRAQTSTSARPGNTPQGPVMTHRVHTREKATEYTFPERYMNFGIKVPPVSVSTYVLLDDGKQDWGMWSWFNTTLAETRAQDRKALLAFHHPPGVIELAGIDDTLPHCDKQYELYLNEYKDVIIGGLAGHTHTDSFRVSSTNTTSVDGDRVPGTVVWVAGAATAYSAQNPSMRVFTYDKESYEITDYLVYYYDLDRSNDAGVPIVEELYRARHLYSLPDMSADSWYQLGMDLQGTDEYLFAAYYDNFFVTADDMHPINNGYHALLSCATTEWTMHDFGDCTNRVNPPV
ncbi:hypothetical protein KIPB_000808 [Kipferlia bialata]|uniref:Sphingomyelin phosphodiesterase C-terminal domain-containing protein n=1 Tax=Kipferlia bialata TaxID=797122 RepID=A0A9K3CP13_9EUKA|nr:hypothetical protein KIPB_000808 [Kipferlia bialata]|eukprot:g808.t1